MRICKLCKVEKQFNYIGITPSGNNIHRDETGGQWIGYVCYSCFKIKYKKPLLEITCKFCDKKFNQTHASQKHCSDKCREDSYRHKYNKSENRKQVELRYRIKKCVPKPCKNCGELFKTAVAKRINYCSKKCSDIKQKENCSRNAKEFYKKTYQSKELQFKKFQCITCGIEYEKKTKRPSKYCSKSCQPKKSYRKSVGPRQKICICGKEFTYTHGRQKTCTEWCDPKVRRKRGINKRLREKELKQATPKWVDKKELKKIWIDRPEGFDVDHIIPINHKDVCGLNVPWNLSYLEEYTNRNVKNGKFDFTNENESWKNFFKILLKLNNLYIFISLTLS